MIYEQHPHRRYNPLRREWVLVSPHRSNRPWQGQSEAPVNEKRPPHDPACYLCAGNERANGVTNPEYSGPYVFDNDFPALLKDTPPDEDSASPLFRSRTVRGTSRVICFSERHDLTLPGRHDNTGTSGDQFGLNARHLQPACIVGGRHL